MCAMLVPRVPAVWFCAFLEGRAETRIPAATSFFFWTERVADAEEKRLADARLVIDF